MDVDNLLIQQVTLKQQIGLVVRQERRAGPLTKLNRTGWSVAQFVDVDKRRPVPALARYQLEHKAINMRRVDRRSDGELAHVPNVTPCSIDHYRAQQRGDARRFMKPRHSTIAISYQTLHTCAFTICCPALQPKAVANCGIFVTMPLIRAKPGECGSVSAWSLLLASRVFSQAH